MAVQFCGSAHTVEGLHPRPAEEAGPPSSVDLPKHRFVLLVRTFGAPRDITMGMATPRITSGLLLIATGMLHQAVGVLGGLGIGEELGGRNLFAEVARGGVIDSIGSDFARMAWFWFLITGFTLLMLGGLARHLERRGESLPASFGWQLGVLGIAGAAFIPASGFWLLIPQAAWIVLRGRRLR